MQVRLPVFEIDQYGNRRLRPDGSPGDGNPIGGGGVQLRMEKKALYNMGFVDLRRINYQTVYEQGTLGPRFLQWEGAKFMTTGDILSTGGVSGLLPLSGTVGVQSCCPSYVLPSSGVLPFQLVEVKY